MKKPPASSFRFRRSFAVTLAFLCLGIGFTSTTVGAKSDKPKRPQALVLGDSMMAMVGVAPEALKELNSAVPVIFGAQGCQLLLNRGCLPEVEKSAFTRLKEAKGSFSEVVVVATGYNEYRDESLAEALRLFRAEAKRQKVSLVWLSYRENGNVTAKAKRFNAMLRRAAKKDPSLTIFDWHKVSKGRETWFSGDKIHLSRGGAKQMARRLGKVIDQVIAERKVAKSTTTIPVTTLPTTTLPTTGLPDTTLPTAAIDSSTTTTTPAG